MHPSGAPAESHRIGDRPEPDAASAHHDYAGEIIELTPDLPVVAQDRTVVYGNPAAPFDPVAGAGRTAIVRAARGVFWEQGFESASAEDLALATGIDSAAIDRSFGSLRGLFDATVDEYLEAEIHPALRLLTPPPVEPGALEHYLRVWRDDLLHSLPLPNRGAPRSPAGANAASAVDTAFARVIATIGAELRPALAHGVRARFPGLDAPGREQLAERCNGLIMLALGLVGADPAAARGVIDGAIELAREVR